MLYTAAGKAEKISGLADVTSNEEKTNIAFMSLLLQGKVDECIALFVSTNRLAEAALFARSYAPSKISEVVALWKEDLEKTNTKAAAALADPTEYPNLFPELDASVRYETYTRENGAVGMSAADYLEVVASRGVPLEERASGSAPAPAPTAATAEEAAPAEVEAAAAPEEAGAEEENEDVDDLDLDGDDDDGGDDDVDLDDEDLLGED